MGKMLKLKSLALCFMLTLTMVVGLMPGMSLTAYARESLTNNNTSWSGDLGAYDAVIINDNVTVTGDTYLICKKDVTVNGSLTVNARFVVYGPGKLHVNGNVVINSGKTLKVYASDGKEDGALVANVSTGDCITGSGTLEVDGCVTASGGENGVAIRGVSLNCKGTLYGSDAAINEENKKDSPYQKFGLNSANYESYRYMYADDGFVDAQTLSAGDTFSADLRGIKNCTSLTLQAGGYASEDYHSQTGTETKSVQVDGNRVYFWQGKIQSDMGYISPYANGKVVDLWQVVSNSNGALVLTGYGISHTHSFTYSASGATITATCNADDCTLPDVGGKHTATLTIAAPTTGNDATITVSPEGALTGYTVKYQTKTGSTWSSETDAAPTTDGIHKAIVTLEGQKASVTYGNNCITYATGLTNGSISGDSGATCGATVTPTITPEEGYELDTLTVTPETGSGVSTVTVNGGTFVMPEANVNVSATFKKINRVITVTQPTGGTLTAKKDNADVTTADYGDIITLGNSPAAGYNFSSYNVTKTGDNKTEVPVNNGTFTMPAYPVTVTGTFTAIDYDVTVNSAENGSVTVKKGDSNVTKANIGDEITLTYNPSAGYQLDTISVTKEGGGTVTVTDNKFTMPASAVTVSATFREITYTVAVDTENSAKATVTDSLPNSNTYTAELNIPADKTYDGETVDLTTATVQKSANFPDNKVTVGAVSFKDQNGNTVTAATDVGTYTASATVGDKTISKSFKINGQTNPITYVKKTKGSPVLTTTNQYIPLQSNKSGITLLKEGRVYYATGNIEIGALIYMGNEVKLILGKDTTVTIYAGIYHIGSSLEIYPEEGTDNSVLIVKGNKTLSSLNNYTDFNGQTISDTNATLSGTIGVYGGKLTVEQGNSNLVSDDISLTLGAGLSESGLTGGTENSDGSMSYGKAAFASLTSLAVKPTAVVTAAPTAKTGLTANGSAQALVNAGTANGGTMQYAMGTDASTAPTKDWSADIPTKTDAGTYYVWYKVVGDDNHNDSEPACVTVTINAPAPAAPTAPTAPTAVELTVNAKTVSAKTLNAAVAKAGISSDTVTTIVLGKKVKKIKKGSFQNLRNANTLVVKSKKLTKARVKGSLKGSSITKVKVQVGKKKTNKKYVKKYKRIFTKKNAGRKVKVTL